MDLVEIVPDRVPPVCKIMNHGRFVYQQSKKLQENRRHQRQNQVKEVKFRIIIGVHDRETKMRQIRRFLHEGHKVKATIWFKRARERSHREIGEQILDEVTEELREVASVESRSSMVGNQMSMILSPARRLLDALRTERAGRAGEDVYIGRHVHDKMMADPSILAQAITTGRWEDLAASHIFLGHVPLGKGWPLLKQTRMDVPS